MSLEYNAAPRYIKIAVDIAKRINSREFNVGDKLRGRSTLASEYNVSPETIRRSAALLQDMGIVKVDPKSGIFILSIEKTNDFIEQFSNKNNINSLKTEIKKLRNEREKFDKIINQKIDDLIEYSSQLNRVELGFNYEIKVIKNSEIIGKTVHELQFWHNTGATITAVKRGDEIFISPGPHFAFLEDDIIYFVSSVENLLRVKKFVNIIL